MSLSDPIYQAVEIAVKATGASAVADLEAHVKLLQSQLQGMASQLKAGNTVTVDAVQEMAKLSARLNDATQAAAAAQRVMAGQSAQLAQTGSSAQAASRGILELSRGFEDLTTGGFLGVLNNIPGTIYNFGQAAKLSATQVGLLTSAASALGTIGYIVYQNWDKVKELFSGLVPPKLIDDLKGIKDAIKELEEKTIKTSVDYQDLKNAREELRKLAEDEATYDRLKKQKSEEQQKRSKVVSEAITEGGGTGDYASGVDNVIAAVQQIRGNYQSPASIQLAAQLKDAQQTLAESLKTNDPEGTHIYATEVERLKEQVKAQTTADETNRHQAAKDIVDKAAGGNAQNLAELSRLFGANQEAFTNRGVDPLRFGAGLANATGPNLFADERRKIQKERDDFARKKLEQSIDERNDSEQKSIDAGQELARDEARKAEAENVWQVQQGVRISGEQAAAAKKAEAEKARTLKAAARGAPKRALEGQQDFYGKQFQQVTGVNDLRAEQAGKEIATQVNKGASPARAAGVTLQKMLAEMVQLGEINRQQQAELLQFYGFFDQASRVMQAQNRGMMNNRPARRMSLTRNPNIQR